MTGAKHPAVFSTSHLTDIDKTKHNHNQENPHNHTRKRRKSWSKWIQSLGVWTRPSAVGFRLPQLPECKKYYSLHHVIHMIVAPHYVYI